MVSIPVEQQILEKLRKLDVPVRTLVSFEGH